MSLISWVFQAVLLKLFLVKNIYLDFAEAKVSVGIVQPMTVGTKATVQQVGKPEDSAGE